MGATVGLIRRCKANHKDAYDELLQQYEKYLYRICYFYCQDQDEALDIMQEVYIKIFRNIQAFDEACPILPWLKKIAVNTCINYQRDHRKIVLMSLDLNTHPQISNLSTEDNVEVSAIDHDYEEILRTSIGVLPENYRIALTLRYIEDLSYQQIADLLELPIGTVKSNIFRGRNALKEELLKNHLLEG